MSLSRAFWLVVCVGALAVNIHRWLDVLLVLNGYVFIDLLVGIITKHTALDLKEMSMAALRYHYIRKMSGKIGIGSNIVLVRVRDDGKPEPIPEEEMDEYINLRLKDILR